MSSYESVWLIESRGHQSRGIIYSILGIVIFRNGHSVEGSTHKQVVDLIRSGGDTLTITGTNPYNTWAVISMYTLTITGTIHELCLA